MNERLTELRNRTRERYYAKYHSGRTPDLIAELKTEKLPWVQRVSRLTLRMCEAQDVVIEAGEQIVFTQTTGPVSVVYPADEWAEICSGRTLHEGVAVISNVCPDWGMVLSQGMLGRRKTAHRSTYNFSRT